MSVETYKMWVAGEEVEGRAEQSVSLPLRGSILHVPI